MNLFCSDGRYRTGVTWNKTQEVAAIVKTLLFLIMFNRSFFTIRVQTSPVSCKSKQKSPSHTLPNSFLLSDSYKCSFLHFLAKTCKVRLR